MKKVILVFLLFAFIFLLFLNFNNPITNNILYESVEVSDFLVSLYEKEYSEEEIKNQCKGFNNSELVSSYAMQIIRDLKEDKYYSVDFWISISYSNDGEVNQLTEKEDTPFLVENNDKFIKVSEVEKNYNFVIDNVTYLVRPKDIPSYKGVLESLNYSYLFKETIIKDNTISIVYISKGNKNILEYQLEYNVFGELIDINRSERYEK